jgi:RNA polymerase sigma-70 factor (ECF subfamily)
MDDTEFEEAIAAHRRSILAYAYTCCRNMTLAEDIVQEACLTAYRKRDTYDPNAKFGSWLISIARFIWLRECDKRGVRSRAMNYLHDNADSIFDAQVYAEEPWQQEKAALRKCVEKLEPQDRKII